MVSISMSTPIAIKKVKTINKTKEKKTIYFAHPKDKCGVIWKKKILEKLQEDYDVIDPYESEVQLEKKYKGSYLDFVNQFIVDKNSKTFDIIGNFSREIVLKDMIGISEADAFICWFPDVSKHRGIGTGIELGVALSARRYPIIVIGGNYHPFLLIFADGYFLNENDFCENYDRWKRK